MIRRTVRRWTPTTRKANYPIRWNCSNKRYDVIAFMEGGEEKEPRRMINTSFGEDINWFCSSMEISSR